MTVQERKEELRRHAAGLPQEDAWALFQRFLALPEVESAGTLMCSTARAGSRTRSR